MRLFNPIDDAYANAQREAVNIARDDRPKLFPKVIHLYPIVLFVLLLVVALVGWFRA